MDEKQIRKVDTMKKILAIILSAIMLFALVPSAALAESGNKGVVYVAPNGNDSADGSIEHPLATIKAARDKVRQLKQSGKYTGGYTVYLRGGEYNMTHGVEFTKEDSGTKEAPVTYRAYKDETVTIIGGVSVKGSRFTKVTDEALLERIVDQSARDKIYMVNLGSYGATTEDIGDPYLIGSASYSTTLTDPGVVKKPDAAGVEVFFNNSPMHLSRYPNSGNITISKVVHEGYCNDGPNYDPTDPFTIQVEDARIKKWTKADPKNILLYGTYKWDWGESTVPVRSIDPDKMRITSDVPHIYGVKEGRTFYAFNLIEELDQSGEYYIDKESRILYIYEPANMADGTFRISLSKEPIITLNNTQYIKIQGIDFTCSRSNAIKFIGGSDNVITDSEISYTAAQAVDITGYRNGIRNSHIFEVDGGVRLNGGDMASFKYGECFVTNCDIERFSRITRTYVGAVAQGGVGNIISHNKFHNGPHLTINNGGVKNKIMYNEFYDVVNEGEDAGCIYNYQNWNSRATEIKYNYFHDIKTSASGGSQGVFAIYNDGGLQEMYIIGNVFENIAGGCVFINGGPYSVAYNNIMINCSGAYQLIACEAGSTERLRQHYEKLEKEPYIRTSEKWKQELPQFAEFMEKSDVEKGYPTDNVFSKNLIYKTPMLFKGGNEVNTWVDVSDNLVSNSDPGFVDLAGRDYNLKSDAPVFSKLSGFRAVPFSRMGNISKLAEARVQNAVAMCLDSSEGMVDGQFKAIDEKNENIKPFLKDGNTYVPLRFLAESLGAAVDYNEGKITISSADVNLELNIGSTDAVKNGEKVALAAPLIITGDRTMVPLRSVSELLNKQVFWHDLGFITVSDDENLFKTDDSTDVAMITYLFDMINEH